MKIPLIIAITITTLSSCRERSDPKVSTAPQSTEATKSKKINGEKNNASLDGLERAEKVVSEMELQHKKMSPSQLIQNFIPSPKEKRKYGGYDYYYGWMMNQAITAELIRRGDKAHPAYREQLNNNTRIYEAVNGPGDTISSICKRLLTMKSIKMQNRVGGRF